MKKPLQISFLFLFANILGITMQAQNLIPNGDFELGPDSSAEGWTLWWDSTCQNPIPVNGPSFWSIVSGTPDRLLEYDIFTGCYFDIDTAATGNAWACFVYNEVGKSELLAPLQKDSLYHLSYYIKKESFSNQWPGTSRRLKLSLNNIGNTFFTPYITYNNWTYYDTVFWAKANSVEIELAGLDFITGGGSGIKIDNIILEKIHSSNVNYINYESSLSNFYPNPVNNVLSIPQSNKVSKIEIYNSIGQNVICFHNMCSGIFDISELPKGIYFIKVFFFEEVVIKKIIKQ